MSFGFSKLTLFLTLYIDMYMFEIVRIFGLYLDWGHFLGSMRSPGPANRDGARAQVRWNQQLGNETCRHAVIVVVVAARLET